MGLSGRTIIEAILEGETDSVKLASLVNYRVRKSREEIAEALEGNRREDLLFELRECLSVYDFYCQKIKTCDQELEKKLQNCLPEQASIVVEPPVKTRRQMNKHTPKFDIETLSYQYYGVNLMEIPNIGANTVLCFLTQIGRDIYKFPTGKHFTSWLRLAPNNKITGGKIISSRTPKGKNKFALALRQAASSLSTRSKGDIIPFFKRVAYKKGRAAAITATARKFAVIIYNMVTHKEPYKPREAPVLTERSKNKIIKSLRQRVQALELSKDQLEYLFNVDSLSVR